MAKIVHFIVGVFGAAFIGTAAISLVQGSVKDRIACSVACVLIYIVVAYRPAYQGTSE